MKKILIPVMALAAMTIASCGNSKSDSNAENADVVIDEVITLTPVQQVQQTKWRLADYTNGQEVVTTDSTSCYELTLAPDSTFVLTTDCNSISGQYTISADSISFGNLAVTRMACPNTAVEEAFQAILPTVDRYRMPTDSVLLLMSDSFTRATFVPVAE